MIGPSPLGLVPAPPRWVVDHAALRAAWPWLVPLDGCPQDPIHHAEGDVGLHTRMVADALVASPEWRALPASAREELFAAALLHDVAKPEVTVVAPDGRVSSAGHARLGERRARRLLWELGVEPARRERVCALVRHHLLPFVALKDAAPERRLLRAGLRAPLRWLALLAEADARGRRCADQAAILEAVDLFRVLAGELECLEGPYPFASDHARFLYFRREGRHPAAPAVLEARGEATLLSGLPAAGKSSWFARHAGARPVVSLDRLRAELGVDPAKPQGRVVAAAREEATAHLRAGRDFVWDATHLTRGLRGLSIDLCARYAFAVRIVCVEAPAAEVRARNAARARPVPPEVLERLVDKWEPPEPGEAHRVDWAEGGT
ncbi:MAG: AAA family ATPase [Planctomycetota bacterium]